MKPVTPEQYRRVVFVASLSLGAIVLTGAAVRLTQAGLGCEDWPACSEDRFVPEWSFHPWVEFGNRLISGFVALATVVAVLSAYRRQPKRPDLIRWAWGLVVGVLAQIILGGITVRTELHPAFVGTHFLLSMVLLWNAAVLWVKAGAGGSETTPRVDPGIIAHSRVTLALATAVLFIGTLVTGTGPNSGDSRAVRLDLDLFEITRAHGVTVWLFLVSLVTLSVRLHRQSGGRVPARISRGLLAASVAQAGLGYWQYQAGVPAILVEGHILGAMLVWVGATLGHLSLFQRPEFDGADSAIVLNKKTSAAGLDKMVL